MIEERIASLLSEKFKEEEFADCFLIEVRHNRQKVEVFLDSDTGITFGTCQKVSRYLESHIDEGGWLGEKYVLEVSSPGVSRPLVMLRQYPKHIGRQVEVTAAGGAVHSGRLIAVDGELITIEEKVRKKEGSRKKTEVVQTAIPFAEIEKTVVKVSF